MVAGYVMPFVNPYFPIYYSLLNDPVYHVAMNYIFVQVRRFYFVIKPMN